MLPRQFCVAVIHSLRILGDSSYGYLVDRETIRDYASAVKNDDAAYFDEDAARALGYDAILAPLT